MQKIDHICALTGLSKAELTRLIFNNLEQILAFTIENQTKTKGYTNPFQHYGNYNLNFNRHGLTLSIAFIPKSKVVSEKVGLDDVEPSTNEIAEKTGMD
jgi:hypothetical protein